MLAGGRRRLVQSLKSVKICVVGQKASSFHSLCLASPLGAAKGASVHTESPYSYGQSSSSRSYRATATARKEDFYKTLGISKGADKEEIKKSYRNMAKKYHPDLNKDDKSAEAKFREVSEAYEVLGDDEKRQRYDNFGHAGVDGNGGGGDPFGGMGGQGFGGFGGFGGGGFGGGGGQQMNPEDIFDFLNQAMGGGGRRGMGQDVETVMRLSFLEAVHGCSKDLSFSYNLPIMQRGEKRQRKSKTVSVDIPAGVDNNIQMRVQGKGGEGASGMPAGDLFVRLQVEEDPYFKREGMNIKTELGLSFAQAALGAQVDVLTLDGMVKMKIKPGTQPGTTMLLRNKGIKHVQQSFHKGNQYVTLNVKVPTSLDERQRELLEEFDELERAKTNTPAGQKIPYSVNSAWSRLKDFAKDTASAVSDAVDAAEKAAAKAKAEAEKNRNAS